MPWMSVAAIGGVTGSSGVLTRSRPTAPTIAAMQHLPITMPTSINVTPLKGQSAEYRNRWYNVGCGTDNFLADEFYRAHRLGIQPPTSVPVLASAAGPGVTGAVRVYISFADSKTGERSALSGASNLVNLVNQAAAVTNIPTTSNDLRVDTVEVWHEVDGETPRLATTRQLGVTGVTESVATLSLGEAFSVSFSRLPRASVCAIYHERLCLAGDARHPDILYVSGITYPERWEGLSFRTRQGEPIVAIIATRQVLLVLCPHSAYALRGWTEDDMVLELIDGDFGTLNAYTPALINGSVWGADANGPWLFNGSFHRIMRDRTTEWKRLYREFQSTFENAFGVMNPNDETYRIYMAGGPAVRMGLPGATGIGTLGWVAAYDQATPEISGEMGQPDWANDAMARTLDSGAVLSLPGAGRGDLYLGDCTGKIRVEVPDYDPNCATTDDGDAYHRKLTIRTGAYTGESMGGDRQEQKTLLRLWSFFKSEFAAWILYVRGGNEECYAQWSGDPAYYPNNTDVFYKNSVPASALSTSDWEFEAETVTVHAGIERVVGRTLTFEWQAEYPSHVRWSGYGGAYGPGTTDRFPTAAVEQPL